MSRKIRNFEARCDAFGWKSVYALKDWKSWRHHERYKRFIASMPKKLTCQACGGSGGEIEHVDEHGGPFIECGWCESTGYVTPYIRRDWLRMHREEKRQREATV